MLRLTLCAFLAACGSSSDTPTTAPKIDDGVRYIYQLGEGSPDAAATVMRRRLARAKIKGWASAQGATIVVDLAGTDAEALAAARDLIARTAKFQVLVVDDGDPIMRRLAETAARDASAQADGVEAAVDQWRPPSGDDRFDSYLRASDREETVELATARRIGCFRRDLVDGGQRVRCRVTGRARLERYLGAVRQIDPSLALPDDHQVAFERVTPHDRAPYWRTYYVVRASTLASPGIADARPIVDPDSGRSAVLIEFDDDARAAFAELSRASVGKKLAFVLDDRVIIAPVINAPVTSGRLTINLDDEAREGEARQLAIALASGPLPGPVVEASAAQLKDGQVVADPNDF